MFPEQLLHPLRDDVSAIGDQQVGHQLDLFFFGQRIENGVEVLDWNARYCLISRVLGQPGKMLVEQLAYLPLEEIDQIHLSDQHHAFGIRIEAGNQVVVLPVIDVQSLISGDDPHFRQLFCGEAEERF